jgi:hypothetical protein
MNTPARPFPWLAATAILTLAPDTDTALAAAPRSERVSARIAERAYARQSIAEARAVRAEARVAAIAPAVPVPPPPRPTTVRRMLRAGVPLNGQPPLTAQPLLVGPSSAGQQPPTTAVAVAIPPAAPVAAAPATGRASDDVSADGTRSVLTAAEEPAVSTAVRQPAGPAVTHPPIELLPTPQPQ